MKGIFLWLPVLLWSLIGALPSTAQETGALLDESYSVPAYRPIDPDKVTVRVSLGSQTLYVREGSRVLLAAACTVGTADTPTPTGDFTIFRKVKKKRRERDPGRGYPMGYWCEFKDGYAIHAGWVHRNPRTNGTIRLHHNVAPKFFELVQLGTPVLIAPELPEDGTVGRSIVWPRDSDYPELPLDVLNSDRVFELYKGPIWESNGSEDDDSIRQGGDLDSEDRIESEAPPDEDTSDAPFGIPVPGKANIILSPHAKDQGYIDVEGLASGTRIVCPWTNKVIRVP